MQKLLMLLSLKIPGSLGKVWSIAIIEHNKTIKARKDLRAIWGKMVTSAHVRILSTGGHSSDSLHGLSMTPEVLLQSSGWHPPAYGSRFQAPGPDRCKHSFTTLWGAAPACPHLAHKQTKRPSCEAGDIQHLAGDEEGREGKWGEMWKVRVVQGTGKENRAKVYADNFQAK